MAGHRAVGQVTATSSTAGGPVGVPRPGRTRRERLAVVAARLGPFARPHRRRLATALAASVVVTLAQLAFPWPMSWLLQLADPGASGSSTAPPGWVASSGSPSSWAVASLVVVGVVLGAAELVQRVSVAGFVVRTVNDARVGILSASLLDRSARSGKRDPGDVVTRVVTDTARLRVGLKGAFVHILQHGLFLVGVSVVLLGLDLWLGLAYLAGLALAFGVAALGADRTADLSRRRRGRESRVVARTLRTVTTPGQEIVPKSLDRERPVAIISQMKGRTAIVVQVVLALTAALVLALAVRFTGSGRLGTGDLAVVASYLLMLHYPMMRMGRQITRLGPQLTSAERLARLAPPGTAGTP